MWGERWEQIKPVAGGVAVLFCVGVLGAAAVFWQQGRWPFSVLRPATSAAAASAAETAGEVNAVTRNVAGGWVQPAAETGEFGKADGVSGCVAEIRVRAEEMASPSVALAPGGAFLALVSCPPGVKVVDLVVAAPPPLGAIAVVGTTMVDAGAGYTRWAWVGGTPYLEPGTPLLLYVFADGLPAGVAVITVLPPETGQEAAQTSGGG